jgi:hypothetical protein
MLTIILKLFVSQGLLSGLPGSVVKRYLRRGFVTVKSEKF